MLIIDFKARLRRLNPELLIRDDHVTKMEGLKHSGIYLRSKKQMGLSYDTKSLVDSAKAKYFAALESGQLDKYLCGVCLEWIPEYDVFNAEYSKITVPGWRTILMRLVQARAIRLEDARRVFKCKSLGESDYDKMSMLSKLRFAKEKDKVDDGAS